MSLNVNGLRPEQNEKVMQLIDYVKRNSINIALLIETNTKCTTNVVNRMRNKIKELGRNTQIIYVDSKAHSMTNSSQLQGIINIVRGGVVSFF